MPSCFSVFPLISSGINTVMCFHEPRLALSRLPADSQLPRPDQLWTFVLWYENQAHAPKHTNEYDPNRCFLKLFFVFSGSLYHL